MSYRATCEDCPWQAEADDLDDAAKAAANHWDSTHVANWCGYCEPIGPLAQRRDHEECIEHAILEWSEIHP